MIRLAPDERILWEGSRAWSEYLGSWFAGGLLLGVGVGLLSSSRFKFLGWLSLAASLVVVASIWLRRLGQRYMVTSQRAIVRRGLLSRQLSEIHLVHVRDMQLTQTVRERLLRTGSLALSTAGQAGAEIVFEGIRDPEGVKEIVRQGMRGPS